MKEKIKSCPFCGGKVTEHPNPNYPNYYIVTHSLDCYLNDGSKPPFNFTLLPKNWCVDQWNKRAVPTFKDKPKVKRAPIPKRKIRKAVKVVKEKREQNEIP